MSGSHWVPQRLNRPRGVDVLIGQNHLIFKSQFLLGWVPRVLIKKKVVPSGSNLLN